jgi:hypothetical protein
MHRMTSVFTGTLIANLATPLREKSLASHLSERVQFAGSVSTGAWGAVPVSAREKNIIRKVKTFFEA